MSSGPWEVCGNESKLVQKRKFATLPPKTSLPSRITVHRFCDLPPRAPLLFVIANKQIKAWKLENSLRGPSYPSRLVLTRPWLGTDQNIYVIIVTVLGCIVFACVCSRFRTSFKAVQFLHWVCQPQALYPYRPPNLVCLCFPIIHHTDRTYAAHTSSHFYQCSAVL